MSFKPSKLPLNADGPVQAASGLLSAVREIWEGARTQAARTVNSALVQANWLTGRKIVEAEQAGKSRAGYGEEIVRTLSRAPGPNMEPASPSPASRLCAGSIWPTRTCFQGHKQDLVNRQFKLFH